MDDEATEPVVTGEARPGPLVTPPPAPSGRRSRYVPAVLDAVIPGLGHLFAGRRRRAILFLTPMLIVLVVAGWIALTTPGPRLVAELLDSGVIWGLIAFQGLFLVWRLLAVGSSLFDPALPRPGRGDAIPIGLILLVVLAPAAYAGYLTETGREAADSIFVEPPPVAVRPSFTPEPDPAFLEEASPSPAMASPSDAASSEPSSSPSSSPTVPRITGLIIGVDSGVGRNTYLTDTMIVVSLDPVSQTVSLVSIPRDMVDVPFSDGRKFRGKINSLVSYARQHRNQFPNADGKGYDVLMDSLGTLLGVPIQYYAKVDLGGFVRVIDVLGGVNVNVARSFCDPKYREYGYANGFSISAGRHHLNGQQALAYARVRRPSGESDFTRAARQQEVVSGVRDAIVKGGFLNDPVGFLKSLPGTVETNVPRKVLPDLADAASHVGRAQTYRAVVTHPLVQADFDLRGSIQVPNLSAIRALAASLFPASGTLPPGKYLAPESTGKVDGSGVKGCAPAAAPRPTPKPAPQANPSVAPTSTKQEPPPSAP